MAKTKGKKINKNDKRNKNESESDSDKYANDDDFDPKNPFDNDEIESFHAGRDKVLLDSLGSKKKKDFQYSSEEEVLAFDDDDSDDDEEYDGKVYGSDDDEEEEEDGKNGEEFNEHTSSWGQKKSAYYSGNKIENDEDAELEEAEAKALQEKMMKQLDTNDFDLDAFKVISTGKALKTGDEINAKKLALSTLGDLERDDDFTEEKLKKIAKNLDKMTKKEKLDFLQQESPELFELVRDFKEKLSELQETLLPIFKCIKSGQLPHSTANEFIINKTKLYLMYCSHLCFYFVLKSQRQPVENHPIVKNILQYRNLTKQINSVDQKLEKEIKFIISSIRNNKQISFVKSSKPIKKVNFKLKTAVKKSIEDDTDSEMDNMVHEENGIVESTNDNGKMDKRAINYQIEKNKGLTPKRNKKYRNPRVVNRIKAHKAIVKRKSIVPVRTQDKRYSGEATGIRTSVVRGVKIK